MARMWKMVLLLSTATGCADKAEQSDDTAVACSGCGVSEDPYAEVRWATDAVSITIIGPPTDYWFGLAEVQTAEAPWTGEDCYLGYVLSDGTHLSYCHLASETGTSLSYKGDPNNLAEGETVFASAAYDGQVGYYLESLTTGRCWLWGDETGWWAGLGCTS